MGMIKVTLEEFAELKGIELSDIEAYIKEYPEEYKNFLKGFDKKGNACVGMCLNCGQVIGNVPEKNKCKCIPDKQIKTFKTEEQMVEELKKDIGKLKLKMLVKETEYRERERTDVDGTIKDVTKVRRKKDVRDLRNILKDKLTTYNIYLEAKAICLNQKK